LIEPADAVPAATRQNTTAPTERAERAWVFGDRSTFRLMSHAILPPRH
jgi:hypothetical protein